MVKCRNQHCRLLDIPKHLTTKSSGMCARAFGNWYHRIYTVSSCTCRRCLFASQPHIQLSNNRGVKCMHVKSGLRLLPSYIILRLKPANIRVIITTTVFNGYKLSCVSEWERGSGNEYEKRQQKITIIAAAAAVQTGNFMNEKRTCSCIVRLSVQKWKGMDYFSSVLFFSPFCFPFPFRMLIIYD